MSNLTDAFNTIRSEINTLSEKLYLEQSYARDALPPADYAEPVQALVQAYNAACNAKIRIEKEYDRTIACLQLDVQGARESQVAWRHAVERKENEIKALKRRLVDVGLEASEWKKESVKLTDLLVGCIPLDLTPEQKTEFKEILTARYKDELKGIEG